MSIALPTRGLAFDSATFSLQIVDAAAQADRVLVHDETNPTLARILLSMKEPALPVALGVIYRKPAPSFEQGFYAAHPTKMQRTARVDDAMRKTSTWWVG